MVANTFAVGNMFDDIQVIPWDDCEILTFKRFCFEFCGRVFFKWDAASRFSHHWHPLWRSGPPRNTKTSLWGKSSKKHQGYTKFKPIARINVSTIRFYKPGNMLKLYVWHVETLFLYASIFCHDVLCKKTRLQNVPTFSNIKGLFFFEVASSSGLFLVSHRTKVSWLSTLKPPDNKIRLYSCNMKCDITCNAEMLMWYKWNV